ncbi:MAG: hypothetical protein IJQ53_08030 [Clostridia bacterium]|nr:hypothetical protein [Clostridia bacterium]
MNQIPNYNIQNERANALCELIKSNIYLVIAVIMSVSFGLSFVNMILTQNVASSVIGLALPLLTLVGVWLLRSGAEKGFRSSPFGLLKVRTISLIVLLIIVMISMLFVIAFSGVIIQCFDAIVSGSDEVVIQGQHVRIDEASRAKIAELTDMLTRYYPDALNVISEHGKTIIIVVCAAVIAVSALALVAAFKANGIITKMKNTILFGYDEPIKTGFLTAILYVFAGLLLIFTFISLFTSPFSIFSALTCLGNLLEIALMVSAAIFYGKVNEIMQ